jgi:hypothetical protein
MLVGSKYEAYKYPTGRELGFLEVKVNSGIGDCLVKGLDRINGIYRIG